MKLEHRHFVLIADVLADLRRELPADDHQRVVDRFANRLAGTNPRFSEGRFVDAANGRPSGRDRCR